MLVWKSKEEEFDILSCVPSDDVDSGREHFASPPSFMLAPETDVTFIAHQYRLVFVIDLSPSLSSLVHVCYLELSFDICVSHVSSDLVFHSVVCQYFAQIYT